MTFKGNKSSGRQRRRSVINCEQFCWTRCPTLAFSTSPHSRNIYTITVFAQKHRNRLRPTYITYGFDFVHSYRSLDLNIPKIEKSKSQISKEVFIFNLRLTKFSSCTYGCDLQSQRSKRQQFQANGQINLFHTRWVKPERPYLKACGQNSHFVSLIFSGKVAAAASSCRSWAFPT